MLPSWTYCGAPLANAAETDRHVRAKAQLSLFMQIPFVVARFLAQVPGSQTDGDGISVSANGPSRAAKALRSGATLAERLVSAHANQPTPDCHRRVLRRASHGDDQPR